MIKLLTHSYYMYVMILAGSNMNIHAYPNICVLYMLPIGG